MRGSACPGQDAVGVVLADCTWAAAGIEAVLRGCGDAPVCRQRWLAMGDSSWLQAGTLLWVVGVLPDEPGTLAWALLRLGDLVRQMCTGPVQHTVRVILMTPLPPRWVTHTLMRLVGPERGGWSLQVLPPSVSPARLQAAIARAPAVLRGVACRDGLTPEELEVLVRAFWRPPSPPEPALCGELLAALKALGESTLKGGWHWRAWRAWLPGYPPLRTARLCASDTVRYTRRAGARLSFGRDGAASGAAAQKGKSTRYARAGRDAPFERPCMTVGEV